MTLPEPVRVAVEGVLTERSGGSAGIRAAAPVSGGCISPTARIETDDGEPFFLKWSGGDLPDGLLTAEARGLRAITDAEAVRVPTVLGVGSARPSWLLLEWLEPGRGTSESWATLGRELARLHRVRGERFGAEHDNFIGSLPQRNGWRDDWAEFWRDCRLAPQVERARDAGLLDQEDAVRFDALYDRLPSLLAPAAEEGPSLLHGDLWNGNVHMLDSGDPALIDPSVYHGHREVDLAMAELFGGFDPAFRSAYEDAWPLAPGYEPERRATYQLYYLLVHVNIFGAGYVSGTRRALDQAGV